MREAEPPVQNVHLDILNKTIGCVIWAHHSGRPVCTSQGGAARSVSRGFSGHSAEDPMPFPAIEEIEEMSSEKRPLGETLRAGMNMNNL
jgi:hypothetical protein